MERGIGVIIPAAGAGTRLGGISKPLVEVGGRPLISMLLRLFGELSGVKRICLAIQEHAFHSFKEIVQALKMDALVEIVEGGEERAISVRNAYGCLRKHITEDDLVCVHDAARPLLAKSDLDAVVAAGWEHGAAFLASRVKDTLKLVDNENFCQKTVDRSGLYAAQTPQVMLSKFLSKSYKTFDSLTEVTDEIMLMEKIGVEAFVVEPRHLNLKLTTLEDLELITKLIS